MRGEKGFALVLTLVVTALMVAAAVELIHQVYVDTSLSRTFRDGQQASLLAESAAYGGIKLLNMALLSQPSYTSLSDKWAQPFKQEDDTGRIEITITEESARINLNALIAANNTDINPNTLPILTALGAQLQIPGSVWTALADWIDSDDVPRAGGAETAYYKTLNPPYSARNGRMATVNELSLVKGFTADMVNRLAPFVTVYSPGGLVAQNISVNVNTAPKEVLMALDPRISASMAQQIIEQRQQAPFKTTGELSSRVDPLFTSLTYVTCLGSVFRITARGFVRDAARTVEAVVRTSDYAILSWQEY